MPQTSTGRKLVARSFEGSKADWIAHVCFDNFWFGHPYHIQAPCIFFYRPAAAVEASKNKPGSYGTRKGSSEKNTGYGAKVSPYELKAQGRKFTPDDRFRSLPLGDRGVAEVRKFYEHSGWMVRDATLDEQRIDKIDLIATNGPQVRKIEVKARGEDMAFPDLFIQTHEANPDKRIS